MMIAEQLIGKDMKGTGVDLIEILSRYLAGGTEENHQEVPE
jgi:hypothetical protein